MRARGATRLVGSLSLVLGALVASICLPGCGGGSDGVPSDVVAQVGNYLITKPTFDHWMHVQVATGVIAGGHPQQPRPSVVPDPPSYTNCVTYLKEGMIKNTRPKTEGELRGECETQHKELQQLVLGFLVSLDWELGQARERAVKLDPEEVQIVSKFLYKNKYHTEAEFQKYLARTGQTASDLQLTVEYKLLENAIEGSIDKEVSKRVGAAAVIKYYRERELTYDTPEKRDVLIVLTATEAQAKRARREISSGKSFQSVARKDSIDPTVKANGGLLKGVSRGENEQSFTDAVFSAKTGVLGGPVHTPFGYYIYEVKAVHASVQRTFAQVRSSARMALISEEGKAALTASEEAWKVKTKCRTGYFVAETCGGGRM